MQDTNIELMEKMPVQKAILRLSIPTILSTIVSLLYNLTDTYFIGLLDDPVQLGAISLAFPIFLVMQAVGNVVGNGAPSYISRCFCYALEHHFRGRNIKAYPFVYKPSKSR